MAAAVDVSRRRVRRTARRPARAAALQPPANHPVLSLTSTARGYSNSKPCRWALWFDFDPGAVVTKATRSRRHVRR